MFFGISFQLIIAMYEAEQNRLKALREAAQKTLETGAAEAPGAEAASADSNSGDRGSNPVDKGSGAAAENSEVSEDLSGDASEDISEDQEKNA